MIIRPNTTRTCFHVMIWCLVTLLVTMAVSAQPQCNIVDTVQFPVDPAVFRLVQDFGAPSPRHLGRYHTGEDWYGGRGTSYGQPVHAIAAGRVTFSSVSGWGRDGGVVIVEHTLPDETVVYSEYGHMTETDAARFPMLYSCVSAGDIVGAIGDIRPAPHLHFEIKLNNPDIPGPGYSWESPLDLGWRQPSKFIRNWQVRTRSYHRWHLDLTDATGPAAPPAELDDHSLIFLDAARLRRATPDGRILWRVNLQQPAVGTIAYGNGALIVFADGSMQPVNRDGTLAERWQTGVALDSPPMRVDNTWVFHTPDDSLVAFESSLRTVLWQTPGVPPVVRWHFSGTLLGVVTTTDELLTISSTGDLIDRATLREPGAFASAQDGSLLALTRGGLWKITLNGVWSLFRDDARGGASSALLPGERNSLYLFDGVLLHAYEFNGALRWEAPLTGIEGAVTLSNADNLLLLTSTGGSIIAVRASDGAVCNTAQVFGGRRNQAWQSLGADGILRVWVADQLIGLDWAEFAGACA